jgi:hypothetical protein
LRRGSECTLGWIGGWPRCSGRSPSRAILHRIKQADDEKLYWMLNGSARDDGKSVARWSTREAHWGTRADDGDKRGEMTRFDRRLRQLEARAASGSQDQSWRWRVWIELKDGRMRRADGEIFSREEFERRCRGTDAIVVLPDNGRDDPLPTISGGQVPRA